VLAGASLEPPPKRALLGVNRRPELVEQRRWELEQWIWRLMDIPQIASSVMMHHFCELESASKQVMRCVELGGAVLLVAQLSHPRWGSVARGPSLQGLVSFSTTRLHIGHLHLE
jgi:hypothetical protein